MNPNVFTEADFLPAEVTNRPDPAEQNHTDSTKDDPHPGSVHSSAPVLVDQPKDTPNLPITPESIRPYPKARMQMGPRKEHKIGKTRILTDTPEKESLEAEAQAKLDKKTKKRVPKRKPESPRSKSLKSESLKKSKVLSIDEEAEDSISDKDMQLIDDSDDESLHIGSVSELQTDEEFSPGNFVLVRFMVGKKPNSAVYYVGQIEEVSGRLAKINYLRKSSEKFIFPECPDCAETDFDDIIMRLPTPFTAGGTGRAVKGLVFGCDLSRYAIK